jgi:hypothetical protein
MRPSQQDVERLIEELKADPVRRLPERPAGLVRSAKGRLVTQPPGKTGEIRPFAGGAAANFGTAEAMATAELLGKPFVTRYTYLDRPILIFQERPVGSSIRPGQQNFFDYGIEPYRSWARVYEYAEGGDSHEHATFYYLWTNDSQDTAVVNVQLPMILNGDAYACGSAAFFGGNTTDLHVGAWLAVWRWIGWGNDSGTAGSLDQSYYPIVQPSMGVRYVHLGPTGGWGLGSARSSSRTFANEAFHLGASGLVVPAHASVLFIIVNDFLCTTEGNTITDQAWINLAYNGGHISSPYVKLTVKTPS